MRKGSLASLGLSISVLLSACDGSTPAQPSSETPNPNSSTMERSLEGAVVSTALQGISGALVEIVNGFGAGTTVASDKNGYFTIAGRFAAYEQIILRQREKGTLRSIERCGFRPVRRGSKCSSSPRPLLQTSPVAMWSA